jgi:hypothetical protein
MLPERQKSFGPVEPSVPIALNAAAPPSSPTMWRTLTSVSTLLIAVGFPNSPTSTGNGGLVAGLAALALDRLEERRLLAADVRTGAASQLDVQLAEQPGVARRRDRAEESRLGVRVLAAM